MSKYQVVKSKAFKTDFKKLNKKDKKLTLDIIECLAGGKTLEPKYKDHFLWGNWQGYKECHIKPDLLLIYKKRDDVLTLTCVKVGSHSDVFKK